MWQSYFYQIQAKYNVRLSTKKPLIVRLDGKDVTKNKNLDLLNDYNGSFLNTLEKTAQAISLKYSCLCIFGSDEISFIIKNPMPIFKEFDKDMYTGSNEFISLFSQNFFEKFNSFNNGPNIFWHAKCFSINEDKIISYLKYRSTIIKNVMTTYFLIRKNAYRNNENLKKRSEKCKTFSDYDILDNVQNGILYYNGKRLNLGNYYGGTITEVENNKNENTSSDFLDLNDF